MIAAMLEHHAHRTVANLRRISIRSFLRHSSTFSSCGASGNPGAVQELQASAAEDASATTTTEATTVHAFTRRKPMRAPLPEHLPRERVVLPSPTECPCCG